MAAETMPPHFPILFLCIFSLSLSAAEHSWQYHARRLTGFQESTRASSFEALKQNTEIEKQVKGALQGQDRYLALDVITALSLKSLIPTLLEVAQWDNEGVIYLCINALLDEKNRGEIAREYEKRLLARDKTPLSVPATVAILDVLGRLGHPLDEAFVETLMQSKHFEIRSATLYYIRIVSGGKNVGHLASIRRAINDEASPLKAQAETLVEEFGIDIAEKKGVLESITRWLRKFRSAPKEAIATPPTHFVKQTPTTTPEAKQKKACTAAYNRLYKKPSLQIRVCFGYKDARPARFVGDRYEKLILLSYLLAPCTPGWNACGFTRDVKDPDRLGKFIQGPDGKPRNVELRITSSAAGPDDAENRRDPFQKWMSRRARENFLNGIKEAEVVFYNGHSRDGGGPDFGPPRITADGHVDYDWYVKEKPGMGFLKRLRDPSNRIRILGFFSCASTKHFTQEIQRSSAKSEVALISSPRLLYYTDALENLLGGISALLGRKCEADFNAALSADAKVGDSHLKGFFRTN